MDKGFKWTEAEAVKALTDHSTEAVLLSDGNRRLWMITHIHYNGETLSTTVSYRIDFAGETREPMPCLSLSKALHLLYTLPRQYD